MGRPLPTATACAATRPTLSARLRARLRRMPRLVLAWARLRQAVRRVAAAGRSARGGAAPLRSLGVEVAAAGPGAQAVFADFRGSRGRRGADVRLVDCAPALPGRGQAALVSLAAHPGLGVPAFDPARWNPVGWPREPGTRVGALGSPRRLPPGASADHRVGPRSRAALRRCHHVEDVASFHRCAPVRAGRLVRLAALGVPVRLADGGGELRSLLGGALHGLMARGVRGIGTREREILSVRLRRLALAEHSLRARASQLCAAAGLEPPARPCVSVILATRRPEFLEHAVASVARQDYPRLELVLALHGEGFAEDRVRRALATLAVPATVVRVAARRPLGAALRTATAACAGTYVTKMDDDDLYDAGHVRDLVAARGYSGAELVGKYVDVAYLADMDRTVLLGPGDTERHGLHVTGSALLIAAEDLDRVGGWRLAPRGLDTALWADVLRVGGAVYRTHGLGVVRVRHGGAHARRASSRFYLERSRAIHAGWRPDLAGMPGARLPPLDGRGRG